MNDELKAVIAQVAEVAGYLWQNGWAERNGGNITVNITELADDALRRLPALAPSEPIGKKLPHLKGKYFYANGCATWRGGRWKTVPSSASAMTARATKS